MNWMRTFLLPLLTITILFISCSNEPQTDTADGPKTEPVFPIGQEISSDNFTGTAWLNMIAENDANLNTHIGNVTFAPGARTNWHSHPGGQILLATDGTGYYQEKGSSIQILQKGDVIQCPPNVEHWHGASPDSKFTHIAIGPNLDEGGVVWLNPVTEEDYNSID